MIVDTSALVAIIVREPGSEALVGKLASAGAIGVGAPTMVELSIVLAVLLGEDPRGTIARVTEAFGIEVIEFGEAHWREAADASLRFGKGRHPARLNFGDCLTYAVARLANRPLLCVGNDFRRTDLTLA